MGYSHVAVSIIYAVLQLGINSIVLYLDTNGSLSLSFAGGFLVLITSIYLVIRLLVIRQLRGRTA
jgi:hypothetical protein